MLRYTYTIDQLRDAVSNSTSYRQVLIYLGRAAQGGNYRTIRKRISDLGIDVSHFTGKGWNKGKELGSMQPVSFYLRKGSSIQSHRLRLRLIKEGLKASKCEICLLDTWNGKPIPLELDHVDGDHTNNEIFNLRILCPNCHAQTSTYCGRNKKA